MSLAIDVDKVESVLLTDGWHLVWNESFDCDSYEFILIGDSGDRHLIHGGGKSGVCATGFAFIENVDDGPGPRIAGPLTAVQAVQERS